MLNSYEDICILQSNLLHQSLKLQRPVYERHPAAVLLFLTGTRTPLQAWAKAFERGYAAKEVRFGVECRAAILQGVDRLADAVQVTLGPKVPFTAPVAQVRT